MTVYIDVRRFDEMANQPFDHEAIKAPWPWGRGSDVNEVKEKIAKAAGLKGPSGGADVPIEIFCASGFRSALAVETVKRWRYTNVTNGGGVAGLNRRLAAAIVAEPDVPPSTLPSKAVSERLHDGFPTLNTAHQFARARSLARKHLGQLKEELTQAGVVGADGNVSTGTKPFLVFSRLAAGVMHQDSMDAANTTLEPDYAADFLLACNRPEADET